MNECDGNHKIGIPGKMHFSLSQTPSSDPHAPNRSKQKTFIGFVSDANFIILQTVIVKYINSLLIYPLKSSHT